jgi:hypothetical protein
VPVEKLLFQMSFRTASRRLAHSLGVMTTESGTFTHTPEQLALREARRLKKERAATNAGVSAASSPSLDILVNGVTGRIIERPWLAVQGSRPNAPRPARIMTWNVRELFFIFFLSQRRTGMWTFFSALTPMFLAIGPDPRP